MNIYSERLDALRSMMAVNGWDAVVITGMDPHNSEYQAPRWKQVKWLTGFSSEAADVVVTANEAGLWTDSRYFIQAARELDGSGVELHKTRLPDSVYIPQWLAGAGVTVVAVDGLCTSADFIEKIKDAYSSCEDNAQVRIVDVPDLLDSLWSDRPDYPESPITTLDVECFGGSPRADKISFLRKWMLLNNVDNMLLSSLDEIAWLLNIRGSDIEYNPLVISYLLVNQDSVRWFVTKESMMAKPHPDTSDSFSELEMDGVDIEAYKSLEDALYTLDGETENIFMDPSSLNWHMASVLEEIFSPSSIVRGVSPVILEKALKTQSEVEALRQTFIDDGLAMESFLFWLESGVASGQEITEWEASEKLTWFRSQVPGYRGNSFENISAYGADAALPHYSTPEVGSPVIRPRGLYLVDSGGQYLTGTTDITRTIPMGECSDLEKEDYTLVLKGMIALSMAVFPRGTAGCQLDILARNPLWRCRRNYGHGTGHGVGFWLCVHEGPQDIRQNFNSQAILPGMVTSNEPAIYRENLYGIRHENIILCKESGRNEFGDWLEFETLTCTHIDTSAVVVELLSDEELDWLNAYNERVCNTLSPLLPEDVALYLKKKTAPLSK
ncbi:MAG: aminopeptidase P family protein [Bacteroidales bacterium]|nr:aminopeptidase P family protein [Bacteroidales bacterium]